MLLNKEPVFRENLPGIFNLLISNALFCAVLLLLRSSAPLGPQKTAILALANFFAAFPLIKAINNVRKERVSLADFSQLVLSSLSYCVAYGLFISFPQYLGLSELVICESLAPALAAWLSGDLSRKGVSIFDAALRFFPIGFLLTLSIAKWRGIGEFAAPLSHALALSAVLVSFLVSQTMARFLTRKKSAFWIQSRFTLLNAIGLSILMVFLNWLPSVHVDLHSILMSVVIGFFIVGIQWTYLSGLKVAEPVLAALALSTSVPMSLFAEAGWSFSMPTNLEVILSAGYCISVYVLVKFQELNKSTKLQVSD